jgi:hypothetical protein
VGHAFATTLTALLTAHSKAALGFDGRGGFNDAEHHGLRG